MTKDGKWLTVADVVERTGYSRSQVKRLLAMRSTCLVSRQFVEGGALQVSAESLAEFERRAVERRAS